MGANSKIEWTHHTFNPWIGCSKVSPGCANCYAEEMMDKRYGKAQWGPIGTRRRTSDTNWKKPLQWNKAAAAAGERHRVFCASLADVFEDFRGKVIDHHGGEMLLCRSCGGSNVMHRECWTPGETNICFCRNSACPDFQEDQPKMPGTLDHLRMKLFNLILQTPNLDWLLLTKRPENVCRMMPFHRSELPLPNIWVGTSVENQEQADKRIPELLKIPAQVRFLSMEPLLGRVDLFKSVKPTPEDVDAFYQQFDDDAWQCDRCGGGGVVEYDDAPEEWGEDCPSLQNHLIPCRQCGEIDYQRQQSIDHYLVKQSIHWVIVGGESGRNARPMHPDWARSLRDQCQAAGVPFFFKQHGEWAPAYEVEDEDLQVALEQDTKYTSSNSPLQHEFEHGVGGARTSFRVGKHAAGRKLDGRTWDEVPEVHHVTP